MKRNLVITAVLVVLAAAGRLAPHVWNVAPVAAAALLAGAVMPRRWAVAVPLVAMFVSDLVIGFYAVPVMLTVYGSFVATALVGVWVRNFAPHRLLLASLSASTCFFLTTNFAVWATAAWYPKTWHGLMLAYTLGLPFFRNTLVGDLFFTGVLFGLWVAAERLVGRQLVAAQVEHPHS